MINHVLVKKLTSKNSLDLDFLPSTFLVYWIVFCFEGNGRHNEWSYHSHEWCSILLTSSIFSIYCVLDRTFYSLGISRKRKKGSQTMCFKFASNGMSMWGGQTLHTCFNLWLQKMSLQATNLHASCVFFPFDYELSLLSLLRVNIMIDYW